MKKLFSNEYYLLFARLVLGFVFIYAGAEKISNPAEFSQSIYNYKLIPVFFVNIMAITFPWIELASGLLLIFGISIKENSTIISSMLLIFIVAIGISLIRGLDIDCGCFGKGNPVGFRKIGENVLLLFLGFSLISYGSKLFSLQKD